MARSQVTLRDVLAELKEITKVDQSIGISQGGKLKSIDTNVRDIKHLLNGFFKYQKEQDEDERQARLKLKREDEPKKGGGPSVPEKEDFNFSSLLGALAFAGAGLVAFIAGLFDDGPLKGIKKILSRLFFQISESILKPMGKWVGTIKGLGQELLERGGKMLAKLTAPFKFLFGETIELIGKQLSGILGTGMMKNIVKFAKGGKGIFTKILGNLVKFISKFAKRIPGIGTLISFSFAFSRFKAGDIIGGLLEMASGIASLFPGIGTALSIGIDILSAVRDVKGGGSKKLAKTSAGNKFIKSVGSWIKNNIEQIPIVGGLFNIGKGIGMISEGNVGEGLKKLGLGFLGLVPGLPSLLVPAINLLTKQQPVQGGQPGETQSMMDKLMVFVKEKGKMLLDLLLSPFNAIGNIIDGIKTGKFQEIKDKVTNIWDNIVAPFKDFFNKLGLMLKEINPVKFLQNSIGEMEDGLVKKTLTKIIGSPEDSAQNAISPNNITGFATTKQGLEQLEGKSQEEQLKLMREMIKKQQEFIDRVDEGKLSNNVITNDMRKTQTVNNTAVTKKALLTE